MLRKSYLPLVGGTARLRMAGLIVILCAVSAFSLNRFDGAVRSIEDYKLSAGKTNVYVYTWTKVLDGSGNWIKTTLTAASGLSDCTGTAITGNQVAAAAFFFCFQGANSTYFVQIGDTAVPLLWLSETTRSHDGVYSIAEFYATQDTSVDNTYPLKNAMAYIGSRPSGSGGKLEIPNGVYKVGSTVRPPILPDAPSTTTAVSAPLPIVLPPGLTLEGTSGRQFLSSSRIQLNATGKTVFKIGGYSNGIALRDFGMFSEVPITTGSTATTAIYATDIPRESAAPATLIYTSYHELFSNLEIRGFTNGINAEGQADGSGFRGWQFDYVRVENSELDGLFPITINARNSDWSIENTTVSTTFVSGTNGSGILIKSAADVSLSNVFGGGYSTTTGKGEAFLKITGTGNGVSTVSLHSCESENTSYSIIYDIVDVNSPELVSPLYIEASGFGDPIAIKSNVTIISTGNSYGADTFKVFGHKQASQPASEDGSSYRTKIYSYGDLFNAVTSKHEGCPPGGDGHLGLATAPEADCRRDFYVYNNPAASPAEENAVVIKSGQKKDATYDHKGIDYSQMMSPLKIFSPPVYVPTLESGDTTSYDHFKAWGYTLARNTADGFLEFDGNEKAPESAATTRVGFRFFGSVYPSADNAYELGNSSKRWSLVRGVTVTSGDVILSEKDSGKELYKIHEDENYIYFDDIRNGKQLMKLDSSGNLIVAGKIYQNGETPAK
jgi:hypothetical protein